MRVLSVFSALVLKVAFSSKINERERKRSILECVGLHLPLPPNFNSDLDALVNILCTTLVIDAELENIAVFDSKRPALCIGG